MDKRFSDTYFDAVLMQACFDAAKSEIESEPSLKDLQKKYPTPPKAIKRVKNALKAKQYKRPVAVLYLQRVAVCILAVVALSFAVLMTSSKVQAAVSETVVEWYDKYIIVNLRYLDKEDDNNDKSMFADVDVGELEIGYIPEGFFLLNSQESESLRFYTYENTDGKIIVINISNSDENSSNLDNENTQYEEAEINGMKAFVVYSEDEHFGSIIWGDTSITVNLSGDLSKDELVLIAENIKPIGDVLEGKTFKDLEINYLPDNLVVHMEEHDDGSNFYLFAQEDDSSITLTINICNSDVVKTYIDNEKSEITETIINGNKAYVAYSEEEHMGTVLWGNQEISVFVSGFYDKETLVKIARNIKPFDDFLKDRTLEELNVSYMPEDSFLSFDSCDDTSCFYLYEGENGNYVNIQIVEGDVSKSVIGDENLTPYEPKIKGCTAYVAYSEEKHFGTIIFGNSKITITVSGTYDKLTLLKVARGIIAT